MSCDFIDDFGERCFGDTDVEKYVWHPNHDEYVGEPESPFPLELCGEHQNEKITWEMIQKTNDILLGMDSWS